jgi:hypothetical protein
MTDDPETFSEQRTESIDPRTTTGSYKILVRRQYGKRRDDKPVWWVICYHLLAKPIAFALTALLWLLFALIARRYGLHLPSIFDGGTR